ncbi:MAG: GNAT family N-acetyltransferase, partial [Betaproteobacteria bacterium]
KMVDGLGVIRVASALKIHNLQLRLVELLDAKNIFQWRNHPLVRKNSTNHGVINWEEHSEWFNKRLNNLDGPLLIGEIENKPVGVVRFDISKSNAEVSIFLVPDIHMKGIGGYLLEKAEMWLSVNFPNIRKLHAKVLSNNEPSKRLFEKLNYSLSESKESFEFSKELGVYT